jgi:IS30 family transposase
MEDTPRGIVWMTYEPTTDFNEHSTTARIRCVSAGVLIASVAASMAARLKRKYKRAIKAVLPKDTDLSVYSQAKLNAVARRLNERPRKTLNYETPAERFQQTIASTG